MAHVVLRAGDTVSIDRGGPDHMRIVFPFSYVVEALDTTVGRDKITDITEQLVKARATIEDRDRFIERLQRRLRAIKEAFYVDLPDEGSTT